MVAESKTTQSPAAPHEARNPESPGRSQRPRRSLKASEIALRIGIAVLGPLAAHATLASSNREAVQLKVDLQKSTLTVTVDALLASLVTFTGQPRSDDDKSALGKAMSSLKSANALFETTAAAGCSLSVTKIDMESSERTLTAPGENTGTLSKMPPDGSVVQSDGTGGRIVAEYSGLCDNPKALKSLGTSWFALFPKTKILAASATRDGKNTATRNFSPAPKLEIPLAATGKK